MLRFDKVSFAYRRRRNVLIDVSWVVPSGRSVLLGPNGAGKSTLLKIGAGALKSQVGAVTLDGALSSRSSARKTYLRNVSWMPQEIVVLPGMSCRECVAYHAWLKGLGRSASWDAAPALLDIVGLSDRLDEVASSLSGGQRRRLGLAQALVASPKVLLLDEPTAGLDPAQRARFRQTMHDVVARFETSIVVSTHQVDDLVDAFDTVAVMNRGEFVFIGSVADFMHLGDSAGGPLERAEAAYSALVGADV